MQAGTSCCVHAVKFNVSGYPCGAPGDQEVQCMDDTRCVTDVGVMQLSTDFMSIHVLSLEGNRVWQARGGHGT